MEEGAAGTAGLTGDLALGDKALGRTQLIGTRRFFGELLASEKAGCDAAPMLVPLLVLRLSSPTSSQSSSSPAAARFREGDEFGIT